MNDDNIDDLGSYGPITPEMMARAKAIQREIAGKLASQPDGNPLWAAFAPTLSDDETTEWEAAEQAGTLSLDEERARLIAIKGRQGEEIAQLRSIYPDMGEGGLRLLQRTVAGMDTLASDIADALDWEHSPESYERAREMRRKFYSFESGFDFATLAEAMDYQGLVDAYVEAVDARQRVLEGVAWRDALDFLTRAASNLLRASPRSKRREEAQASAAAGWAWQKEVREYAFKRREKDRTDHPKRSRRQSIDEMLNDVRALYNEKGKARNVTLSSDDQQAFDTIERWFIAAKLK